MNLKELKEEFSKYCHPSWIGLLSRRSFSGLNRETYQSLIHKIEIIRNFRIQYESEINKVIQEFKEREKALDLERGEMAKRVLWITAFSITLIFLISGYILDNLILRGILSFVLGVSIGGYFDNQNDKIISYDEKKEYEWLLLRPASNLDSICDEYIKSIRKELRDLDKRESKEYIQNMNPYEFEHLTAKIFTHFGYVAKVTKGSGDKGVDINLEKNGERQIVQCKRYKKRIGTPIVRDFIGTMSLSGIHTGFIVTTSDFSFEVVSLLLDGKHNVELIDIETLIILLKMMNDGDKSKDILEIVNEGMKNIRSNAAESEYNQAIARINYKRTYHRY